VRVGLRTEAQVRKAFREIVQSARHFNPSAELRGVMVSPMAPEGLEVIIGTKLDDQFGPVIMFGIGGVLVEILKDVTFHVLPLSPTSARKMIRDIKSTALLDGFRGSPPRDRKALAKLLLTCSEVIEAYPQIQEMDLNPVRIYEHGLTVIDARILLKPAAGAPPAG
jgi:acetyltransferase